MVPHFFLDLHECGSVTKDTEGFDFPGEAEAREEALRSARDIMCGELQQGALCLGCYIEVLDANRRHVFTLPFSEAIKLSGL